MEYVRADELDPGRPEPQGALCLFYHDCLGDYEKALAAGRAFQTRGGSDPEIDEVVQKLLEGFGTTETQTET